MSSSSSSLNRGLSSQSNEENDGHQNHPNEETSERSRMQEIATAFLVKHCLWKIHQVVLEKETSDENQGRPTILDAMMQDKTVVLHSLKTALSKNGKIGKVQAYLLERDRFEVMLMDGDNTKVALRAKNLKVVSNEDEGDEANAVENKPIMTSQVLAESLFRPGSKFVGKIQIPGLQGLPGRRDYFMVVDAAPFVDENGVKTGILARHCAYDDEQFVWIQQIVEQENNHDGEPRLAIQYADGETQCRGTWNHDKMQFEGTVRQLLPTEDGGSIYHARDEVTHTFTLSPTTACNPSGNLHEFESDSRQADYNVTRRDWERDLLSPSTKSLVKIQSNSDMLRYELLQEFRVLCRAIDTVRGDEDFVGWQEDKMKQLWTDLVLKVDWKSLLITDTLATEQICAKFRRWAQLLDDLSFSSVEERTSVLAKLSARGVTRAAAHVESDNLREVAKEIVDAWSTFGSTPRLPGIFPPSSEDLARVFVICARLERNYHRFDGALRRAEERLTDEEIRPWIASSREESCQVDGNAEEVLCAICHVALEEESADAGESQVLRLPCGHSFHNLCLREWLRYHSQCPVCRFELKSI